MCRRKDIRLSYEVRTTFTRPHINDLLLPTHIFRYLLFDLHIYLNIIAYAYTDYESNIF